MDVEITECQDAEPAWIAGRAALWPEATGAEHEADARRLLARRPRFIALIARSGRGVAGFAEARLRSDPVNGCASEDVAFLEGLWVARASRRRGVARALIAAIEAWARGHGCTEFASDALLENLPGHAVHRATGFEETERVVYFRKRLADA